MWWAFFYFFYFCNSRFFISFSFLILFGWRGTEGGAKGDFGVLRFFFSRGGGFEESWDSVGGGRRGGLEMLLAGFLGSGS